MRRKLTGGLFGVAMGAAAMVSAQTPATPVPMAEMHAHKASAPSTSLTLTVDGKTITLTPETLTAMPQHKIATHNGHSNVDEVYTGVAVSELLAKQGVSLTGDGAKKVYRSYLRATERTTIGCCFRRQSLRAACTSET